MCTCQVVKGTDPDIWSTTFPESYFRRSFQHDLDFGTLDLGTLDLGTLALGTLELGTLDLGTLGLGTLDLGTLETWVR